MSRSYKKHPFVTDNSRSKEGKRLANRKFRHLIACDETMAARPQHKKMTESWDICDYRSRMTEADAINWYYYNIEKSVYFKKRYPTLEKWLKAWRKWYKNK